LPPEPARSRKNDLGPLPGRSPSSLLPGTSGPTAASDSGPFTKPPKLLSIRWWKLGIAGIVVCLLLVLGPALIPRLDTKSTPAAVLAMERKLVVASEAIRAALACTAALRSPASCSGPKHADPDASLAQAKAAYASNNTTAAAVGLYAVLNQAPNNGEARYLLGSVLHRSWKSDVAEVELQKAIDLGYESKGAVRVELARAVLRQQKWQQVIDKTGPSQSFDAAANATILALHGRAFLMLKEYAKAQLAAKTAADAQADNVDALLLRALISAHQGDLGTTLQHTEALVTKQPEHFEGLLLHADLLRMTEKHDEALAIYAKLLKLEPYYVPVRMARASLYLMLDKPGEAQADVNAVTKFTGNNPALYYMQSMLLLKFGRYADAQNPLVWIRRHTPDFPVPALALAYAYYSTGEIEQARHFARQQLSAVSHDRHAQKLLDMIADRRARGVQDTSELDPNSESGKAFSNEASSVLARAAYFQSNEFAAAVSSLKKGPSGSSSDHDQRATR